MVSIEDLVENYDRAMSGWEVSAFDIIQSNIYQEWFTQNDNGMNVENAEEIIRDGENIHISFVRPPRKIMDKILYNLGLDISDTVERQLCRHKTFGGAVVYGERYVGYQRVDSEWKNFVKRVCA